MPTYQYACTNCGHRFDAVQPFSDASLTECPVCSGVLRKVFSSVGIVFKGSGFYRTDSRAGAGSTVAKGEAKSDVKAESTADTKAAASSSSSSSSSSKETASSSSSGSSAAAAAS